MGNLLARVGWRDVWLGRNITPELKLLMIGLDAVGKTTLLYRFKLGEFVQVIPTIGFNVESFSYGHVTFTVWEVGGGDKIRSLWHHYYKGTRAFMFLVDSSDRRRLDEARDALHFLRENPKVQHAPLLILANKQDLPNAVSVEDIAVRLDIYKLRTSAVAVLPVVVVDGTGLSDALDWLTLQLTHCPPTNKTTKN